MLGRQQAETPASRFRTMVGSRTTTGVFIMALLIVVLGFYLIFPLTLILINSFNTARLIGQPTEWGLDNWRVAFGEPRLWIALRNTFWIYGMQIAIAFPTAVLVSWTLARTKIRFSYGLEYMFWVSYMLPTIATTIGWIMLMDRTRGFINIGLVNWAPFIDQPVFNIFSVPGIVWAYLMGNALSQKVMLLTPAFRNMDSAMEEASRVSGATKFGTMLRVTLPVMMPAMVLVFMLNVIRLFNNFEIEQLLGTPIRFYVYSTMIYQLLRFNDPPLYGQATALASVTLLIIALVIPLQRWLTTRKRYTTVTGTYRPGLTDLGRWQPVVFALIVLLIFLLTIAPVLSLVVGSFMSRAGIFIFNPTWTLSHWELVFSDRVFVRAAFTTFLLSATAAIVSPLLFSMVAYALVRTRWPGRWLLDSMIWGSAAIPGMLAGLGLLWMFLGTPFLRPLFGTIWVLLLVVIIQGNTTGVNMFKAAFLQVGQDMEDAARISGAGWLRTYFKVWIPLLMPTMVLIGTINFVLASQTTSSIILLASRETITLSIVALEWAAPQIGKREAAGIVGLIIVAMSMAAALLGRMLAARVGLKS